MKEKKNNEPDYILKIENGGIQDTNKLTPEQLKWQEKIKQITPKVSSKKFIEKIEKK